MSISSGLRNVLNILAEITHNNTEESIYESAIVERSGLPESEVQNYLKELESRGLAREERNRPKNAPRLWSITREGIKTLEDQNLK